MDESVEMTVYDAAARSRSSVRDYFRQLVKHRAFIWHHARTELKAEHYNTVFGQIWIVLSPLLLALVYLLLRTVIRSGAGEDRGLVVAHLIWAVFFFQFTAGAVNQAGNSIVRGERLILNSQFPRAVLPIASVLKHLLEFPPTLLVYAAFHLAFGLPVTFHLLWIPVVFAMQAVFTLGVGMFAASLTVFFRDTASFMPFATRLWLYVSPILYRIQEIPENLLSYLRFNPLYPVYGALSQVIEDGQAPSPAYLAALVGWAIGAMVIGGGVFLAKESDFATRF